MQAEEYNEFTVSLKRNLEADPRVIGLVAVGSMAQQDYLPDRWSDHDFFVIVQSGNQAVFRTNLAWLPDFANIVFYFQETAHGLKVVYSNGHLLEFAIFDLLELPLAKVNRYRLLLDRGGVEYQLKEMVQVTSDRETPPDSEPDKALFGQFLTNLLVGVGRYRRGEKLSGYQFVKMHALRHLLILLEKYLPSPTEGLLDNLDPFRRFERVFPDLEAELNEILRAEVPVTALGLLNLAERELQVYLQEYPGKAVEVIRSQIVSTA